MKAIFLRLSSIITLIILLNSCQQQTNTVNKKVATKENGSSSTAKVANTQPSNFAAKNLVTTNIVSHKNIITKASAAKASAAKAKFNVNNTDKKIEADDDDDNIADREDGIMLAQEQEFKMTKDVKLGYIPKYRLINSTEQLRKAKLSGTSALRTDALTWIERGPNTDTVGQSNGNGRPGTPAPATSGRMRAIMVDMADATNKTVFVGGIDGGIWKTTDISAYPATWTQPTGSDFYSNLAVSSICQNPANTDIMYFGTGEKTFNLDAVQGGGVWKSTDHGVTWNLLPSTTGFYNVSKMACDAAGNVYVATIGSGAGIQRSTDGGNTWTAILPTTTASGGATSTRVTEMKISSTGRLHIVCGYYNTAAANAGYFYTDNPATVTPTTWTLPVTSFSPLNYNCELVTAGNVLYVLNSNSSFQTPTVFRSIDGGAHWVQANTTSLPTSGNNAVSSGQAWYNLAIAVDPVTPANVVVGGLNCFKSIDSGKTFTQTTEWVTGVSTTATNYVHADQHFMTWNGNQVLVGCDGGIFYSSNGGSSYADRNTGLRIKQFYACAIHPTTTNYFLAGAQDNGCHQLTNPGLGLSTEITGGDGAFVHIDQDEPQYQFASYVYNQYRRSTDGGNTWSAINFSTTLGQFINPTDYDDAGNKFYAGYSAGNYLRWDNPQTGSTAAIVHLNAFNSGSVTHVMKSHYTANRVFFGTDGGKIVMADNANLAAPTTVDITGSTMNATPVSCVAIGTNDNNLIATFSNYGSAHVWMTTTGGGTSGWTNISGNLPDIPVRWAMFFPEDNTKAILATEMGVFETNNINGSSTVWTQDPSFPIVRTDMLKYRPSDGTVAAATHGRGLWTSSIPHTIPYVRFAANYGSQTETTAATTGCRNYKDYIVNMNIDVPATGNANVTLSLAAGNTATQGVDFDFTTNGSFTSPSNTLTFASGSSASNPITIRIYDDAETESTETFTLNYTVAGTTNAIAAPSSSSYTFTILDNDAAPVGPFGGSYTIGTFSSSLTSNSPFQSNTQRYKLQVLYTATELKAAGITSAAKFNSMNIRVVTKNSTQPFIGFTIGMANTGATNLNTGFVSDAMTQVYTGNYSSVVGDNTFNFTAPFAWDGSSNVAVQYCFDNGTGTDDVAGDILEGTTAPLGSGIYASIFSNYTANQAGSGCSLPAAYINTSRPKATFGIAGGGTIETVASNNKTENVADNGTYYFYSSATGNLINNLSGATQNLGCVNASVFEAGTTWQTFYGGQRSQKVIDITPTTNSGASYTVGLYFTAAELGGFTPSGLKIAHTSSATLAGATSANTVIAPTTVVAYGNGYLYTASFTGFSKFFLTSNQVMWVGNTSTDWNTASNWSVNRVPDSTDYEIVIPAGTANSPLETGINTSNNLTIQSGATVTVTGSLHVSGTLQNNGTLAGSGNTVMNGTLTQAITGTGNISNLTLSNSSTVAITASAGNMVNLTGVLTLTAGTLSTNGNMTLKSTATGTASIAQITGGTITGNITVERYMSNLRAWRLLSMPFSSSTSTIKSSWMEGAANVGSNPSPGYGTQITTFSGDANAANFDAVKPASSIRTYASENFNSDATHTPNTTALITASPSYFLFVRGDRSIDRTTAGSASSTTTLRSAGLVRQGLITAGTTSTNFSLIPNVYASPIDFDAIKAIGANSGITRFYVWDPNLGTTGNYRTVDISGSGPSYTYTSTPSGGSPGANNNWRFIESGTAFFVPGSTTVSFTEAVKTSSIPPSSMFRTVSGSEAQLEIDLNSVHADNSTSLSDGARLIFDNSYSADVDNNDAKKISSFDLNFGIQNNNDVLSIEKMPLPKQDDIIPLKMWGLALGNYQFEIQPANFSAQTPFAYLYDSYLNVYSPIDLKNTTTVNFSITADVASYSANRFSISFKATQLSVDRPAIVIYPNPVQNGLIRLQFTNQPKGTYSIKLVNTLGQTMLTKQIDHAEGSSVEILNTNKIKGAYLLEIVKPDNTKTVNKLVIN